MIDYNIPPFVSYADLEKRLLAIHFLNKPLIKKALQQAQKSHGHILRESGSPYLEQHIYAITLCIIDYCQAENYPLTPELIASALLHDVLEDDESINDQKFIDLFGHSVYQIVKPLTKKDFHCYPGKDKYEKKMALNVDYFVGLEQSSQDVAVIKMSDRLNNILTIHLTKRPAKIKFYLAETKLFYLPFAKKKVPYYFEKINDFMESL